MLPPNLARALAKGTVMSCFVFCTEVPMDDIKSAVHRLKSFAQDAAQTGRTLVQGRAVANLTVPGGQELHFPNFSSNFDQFFLFFLKLDLFSSSFWFSGWASRPPGKALATPLVQGVPGGSRGLGSGDGCKGEAPPYLRNF